VADAPRGAPDGELVRRFLAGDAGAATELITRHERRVYAVCLRVLGNPDDAADAAQDALLAMIRKLDGFRGEAAFTTWLYRVAMNVCYDHLRRAKRRPVLRRDDDAPAPEPALDDHADAVVAQRDHVRPYRTRRLVRVGGSDRGQGDPAAPGQREPAVRARRWHVAHHTPPEPAAYPEVARCDDPIHSKERIAVGNGRVWRCDSADRRNAWRILTRPYADLLPA